MPINPYRPPARRKPDQWDDWTYWVVVACLLAIILAFMRELVKGQSHG